MTTMSSQHLEASALAIAGPNLTIDRTMRLRELVPGRVLRATEVVATAGGKGLNVARAARALGLPATLISLLPGHTGAAAARLIAQEHVALLPVPTSGEIRSTAVVVEEDGRVTVINEPGPQVPEPDWRAYEREVGVALEDAAVLVCSGSLPPGAPVDGYARLAAQARARGLPAVIDVAGAALGAALDRGVGVVVPNLGEAEALLDRGAAEAVDASEDAPRRSAQAASALVGHGAQVAVVTAAAAGAALAQPGAEPLWLAAPSVAVRNPIGAGDAFAAGLAAALARGQEPGAALREAVAAGAAAVEYPLAGDLERRRMHELLEQLPAPAPARA